MRSTRRHGKRCSSRNAACFAFPVRPPVAGLHGRPIDLAQTHARLLRSSKKYEPVFEGVNAQRGMGIDPCNDGAQIGLEVQNWRLPAMIAQLRGLHWLIR